MGEKIIIVCPSCQQKLRIPSDLGALEVTCTACGKTFSWDVEGDPTNIHRASAINPALGRSAFIKELAKYFMDFLETDFHKRRNPKRSIRLRDDSNLLVCINLNKYPTFNNVIWRAINQTFKNSLEITKGAFTATIPQSLLRLIDTQVNQLSDTAIENIVENISRQVDGIATQYKKEYETALTLIIDSAEKTLKEELVIHFVRNLEISLERLNLGDENTIFLMEEDLSEVLMNLLQNKISELLNRLIAQENLNIPEEIKCVFSIDDVKNSIIEFFENFQVTDLFAEISEMDRNRSILDKQEFYLYFFDISFGRVKYPIFYIPFNVYKAEEALRIEFDSQVYINKKALEFIAQEYNKETGKRGSVKLPTGRIIYIAQYGDGEFPKLIKTIISEVVDFFQLDSSLHVDDKSPRSAKSFLVRATNSAYISLFDKSDEALINDYEQILELLSNEDGSLGEAFSKIVEDFIHENPPSFNTEVEDEWDDSEINDRLVAVSPIPLNSEQRQILSAIKKRGCNYIAVEGPPGTGKSHTITAIAFNAILANQSVLVLSDKKEALDVVEEKISDTMNKVRYDKKFQNPILRLGKTGSTYSQILSKSSIDNIKAHYRAVRNEYEQLEQNIEKSSNSLKEDIEAEALAYEGIDIRHIFELCSLEEKLETNAPIDIKELTECKDSYLEVEEIRNICRSIATTLNKGDSGFTDFLGWFGICTESFKTSRAFHWFVDVVTAVKNIVSEIMETFPKKVQLLKDVQRISDSDLSGLEEFLSKYENLRSGVFKFLFKAKQVKALDQEFSQLFPYFRVAVPHKSLDKLRGIAEVLDFANKLNSKLPGELASKIDYLNLIQKWIANESFLKYHQKFIELQADVKYVESTLAKYPVTCSKIRFDPSVFKTYYDNELTNMADEDFLSLLRYLDLYQKITKDFKSIPAINYNAQSQGLEDLTTLQMTYLMDGRLISFYENNRRDARSMRDIIRQKKKFDRKDFGKLKEAFPCILAGIRDYAEFIPLEPEIFDLVIIDEASQVSIAQAFPALLRAKRVVIFGDKKQFSNVKAAHARSDTNREYLNRLEDIFRREVSTEQTKLVGLGKFNIRTSILEFFEFICNYNARLLKHFRGYKELISYSNKFFYQNTFHTMKIRGKPIDEVLKFSLIEHDGKAELMPNSNTLEAEFIISQLIKIKEAKETPSVGIITPHTNQQKKLVEMISKLPDKDYFYDELKLKIMTFDTCQGEERDLVFYSMVATRENDRLWGVFIKDLNNVDLEEEGMIKAQRLNVGFSRAKGCMHFVLSKPIEEYVGSIGDALRHYNQTLKEARKEKGVEHVDSKSKMEPKVLNWFYQTQFWKENQENADFIPQFEIGKYLRQMDKTYTHPEYVVDFLLVYNDTTGKQEHKIIIEYDGFREHFGEYNGINEFNYESYYSREDIYRQKVLEGYGYKFLRINKFNLGNKPVQILNDRITQLLKNKPPGNRVISVVLDNVEAIQTGDMKECPKCKNLRSVEDFADSSLITGYGRFCKHCKGIDNVARGRRTRAPSTYTESKSCPKCGSPMVLRDGRYGLFYGCSKYPYCKGTRNI